MTMRRPLTAACLGFLLTAAIACNSTGGAVPTGPSAVAVPPPPPSPTTPPPPAIGRIFGTITELTTNGQVPVAGVYIEYCGYDGADTDATGFYQLSVPNGIAWLYVRKVAGFKEIAPVVTVSGETRLDIRLERE